MKTIGSITLFFLLILGAAWSTGKQEAATGAAAKPPSTLNILFCTHHFTEAVKANLSDFEAKEGVKVNIQDLEEGEYFKKVLIELSSGNPFFDALMLNDSYVVTYAEGGWIEPLTSYVQDPKLTDPNAYRFSDFPEGSLVLMRNKGVLYGIPVAVEPQVLFYRTDLLAQKGLEVPKTMDQLYETAKKLKTDDVAGMALRLIRGQGSWWPWSGIMADYKATWVDENGKPHLDEPAAIEATKMYTKINKDAGPAGVMNYGWYEVENSFAAGKTAMILDANSFMQMFEDPQKSQIAGKVGVAPIPAVNDFRACAGGPSWGVAMAKQSKNKDAAWRFLQWATSPAIALKVAIGSGTIARDSIWSDPKFVAKYPFPDWVKASRESNAKYSVSYLFPRVPQFAQLVDIVDLALQEAYKGDQPVEAVMKTAQQKTVDALSK